MIFISGTDTGVGKTYCSIALIKELIAEGYKLEEIAYYKPIQCGRDQEALADLSEGMSPLSGTDMGLASEAVPGLKVYCSYFLEYPAAPILSAEMEDIQIDIEKIKSDFEELKNKYKFLVVEGAGGLAVPVKENYLISDLTKDLDLPVLIVARPDLGTINHSLLSIEHARGKNLEIAGLYVNSYSESIIEAKLSQIEANFSSSAQGSDEILSKESSEQELALGPFVDWEDPELAEHIKTAPDYIAKFSNIPVYQDLSGFIEYYFQKSHA